MSLEDKALKRAAKFLKKTIFSPRVPLKHLRLHYDSVFGIPRLPNNIDKREVSVGPVQADLLSPELALGKQTILYVHGGGFVAGSRFAAGNLCASLAHESACRLLLPEYRLAPEYPFPTALEDCYHAYSWLLNEGISNKDIVFAGDGAGANLVIALVHYLESKSIRLPAGIVALSPWVDLSCSSPIYLARKNPDPLFTRENLSQQALQYTYHSNFDNPHVSPINGDFSSFPPIYIQCGNRELFVEDAQRLAEKAKKAGVPVADITPNMWHLFQALDSLTPEAQAAVRRLGQWIRGIL